MLDLPISELAHVQQMVFGEPWMVTPEKYDAMCIALESRIVGIRSEAVSIAFPKPAEPYTTPDGVRVIPVHGVLSKRANLVTQASGGASTEVVGKQIDDAVADHSVIGIVLDVDSPGGAVDGTFALSDKISFAAEQKPVSSFIDGQACSGGYAIASSASYVVASQEAMVGHIGVVMTRTDRSKANEKAGVTREVFTSGKYKAALATSDAPLTDDGRSEIQFLLDSIYSLFITKVAASRGVTPEDAHAQMGDGRTWIGATAVAAGLVDSTGTLNDAINAVVSESRKNTGYLGVSATNPPREIRGEKETPAMKFFQKIFGQTQEPEKPEGAPGENQEAAEASAAVAPSPAAVTKPEEVLEAVYAASKDEIQAVTESCEHLGLSMPQARELLGMCAEGVNLDVVLRSAISMSAKKNGGPVMAVAEHRETPVATNKKDEDAAMKAMEQAAEQTAKAE